MQTTLSEGNNFQLESVPLLENFFLSYAAGWTRKQKYQTLCFLGKRRLIWQDFLQMHVSAMLCVFAFVNCFVIARRRVL